MSEFNTKAPILGAQKEIVIDITTSNGVAYAANDVVGTAIKLEDVLRRDANGNGSGLLKSVTVFDKDKQDASFDLHFFSQDPTSLITSADNAAFAMTVANQRLASIGFAKMDTTSNGSYSDLVAGSIGEFPNLYKALWRDAIADVDSGDLWVIPVIKGAATFTSTSGLQMKLVFWPN